MIPDFTFGNFVWWLGKVEDIKDPKMLGRVKVKIFGYYEDIKKDELPWAMVMGPIQSASYKQVGYSPTGMLEGTTVVGFFLDGEAGQVPLVIGTLYGEPDENDVHQLSREEKKGQKNSWGGGGWQHPGTSYAGKYPECHTIATENGVILELDSTKGKERYAWEHPKGTWSEATHEGDFIHHTKKDHFVGVEKDSTTMIAKDANIWVGGNATIKVDGNVDIEVKGNYKAKIDGNYELKIGGTRKIEVGGTVDEKAGGNHTVKAPKIYLN